MKHLLIIPLVAMLATSPVAAQRDNAEVPQGLLCTAWAAIKSGQSDDPGLVAILAYFVGQYEGAAGRDLEPEVLIEVISRPDFDLARIERACMAEARRMATRMQDVGQELIDYANSL